MTHSNFGTRVFDTTHGIQDMLPDMHLPIRIFNLLLTNSALLPVKNRLMRYCARNRHRYQDTCEI
jgi:hypothetical protein